MKIALICGGSSLERGISLNSARSALDHLDGHGIEIIPIYLDYKRNPYKISKSQLYSNTPSDFDFKLQQTAEALTEKSLVEFLKTTDIVFPIMHGQYGEDGGIQSLLEKYNLPYVGTTAEVCKVIFDKFTANELLKENGFFTLPSTVLKIYHKDHKQIVKQFFKEHNITRAIVKPASGGSSIGVFSVATVEEALSKAELIFSKRMDTRVVIEPFAEGKEFTVIVVPNRFGLPVAILPTEIETDYKEHQIFDFRKKYLPTRQVVYHCPPRFSNEVIEQIQINAEQIFSLTGMRDFARFDGWVLPDGNIWFADLNPVSGMEQNSFLFQQSSRVGMSHKDFLRHIVRNACHRYGIKFPDGVKDDNKKQKSVNVLFGGQTSERQVSLMSGTNVWLKLKNSDKYNASPFLLDTDGSVWKLPYTYTLNHTVEEILDNCINSQTDRERLAKLEDKVKLRLALLDGEANEPFFIPKKMPLMDFIKDSKFVFIGLHGGIGEDGTLQKLLKKHNVKYNGSDEKASELCINKWETKKFIEELNMVGLSTAKSQLLDMKESLSGKQLTQLWDKLRKELKSKTLIVKPVADGCSSGVVHLYTAKDLSIYVELLKKRATHIPKNTFRNQNDIVEMPLEPISELLIEQFIETDIIRVKGNKLKHYKKSGWIEVTIGLIEEGGVWRVFNPSMTVAEGEVLSVEEKFQGGTGVNITPPPSNIVSNQSIKHTKSLVLELAKHIGIKGYARIDAFMNVVTGNLMVIEVNTLPALTPSTVLYQQALTERPSIFPRELIEKLVENKGY